MFQRSNSDRKLQSAGIRTELLNQRNLSHFRLFQNSKFLNNIGGKVNGENKIRVWGNIVVVFPLC